MPEDADGRPGAASAADGRWVHGALVALGPGCVPSVAADAFVAPGAVLVGTVSVAASASVWYGAVLRAESAEIRIGPGSNVQDNAVVHVDAGFPAVIGTDVSIGHGAVVHGARIDDGALVGMNATVLNGAVIGAGSLVAAGAVVLEGTVVPPGSLVAGVPARVRRALGEDEGAAVREGARSYRALTRLHAGAVDGGVTSGSRG